VVNNVVVIALFIGIVAWFGSGNVTFDEVASNTSLLLVMGIGTTLGIAAMAAVLWPALKRAHIPIGWNFDFRHPSVVAIAKLSGWTFGYVITNLITYAIFQILANGNDGVTIYAYAWIFFQVPYGLWTVSVMTAYTPELAQLHSQGSQKELSEKFSAGLRLIFVVVLPATVLMALLSQQIVDVVLQHGQFDAASADTTGNTLAALVIGLPAFSLFLYVARGFTSQKDTRTPFILNAAQSVIAIALAFLLVREFGVVGIAAAGTIGYVVLSLIAIGVLDRRIGAIFAKRTRETLLKIVVASALLAGVVIVLRQLTTDLPSLFVLALCGVVGAIIYFVALHLLHVSEVRQIVARFKR
jgi:putative peptidoglycan lipid II flippase